MAEVLRVERLSYRYPLAASAALRAADLVVGDGFTVVTGNSGGGKSTLLRLANGLVPHFHGGLISGRATSCGLDVLTTHTRTLSSHVGFVFQDPEQQSVRSRVAADVAFALENAAVPSREMHARVADALDAVGAGHLSERRLPTLSGGERQRVAIAGAIALAPRLLVLDEPLSQLDADGARDVVAVCMRLRERGIAILCSEHRLTELVGHADAWVSVENGVVGAGDVLAEPSRPRIDGDRTMLPDVVSLAGAPAWAMESASLAADGGQPVLENITAQGSAGEVVVLMGANGSGKTTLLRALAGFVRPNSGTVWTRPGRTAYLPQNPGALLHRATIGDEIRLTLRRARSSQSPTAVLRSLGITHLETRAPHDLSSGERQRAATAAILAGAPELALLDEPTRGMDPSARSHLISALRALTASGSAVVLATHDRELAARVADRVIDIGAGGAAERGLRPRATASGAAR